MISSITHAFQYRLDIASCGGVYLEINHNKLFILAYISTIHEITLTKYCTL